MKYNLMMIALCMTTLNLIGCDDELSTAPMGEERIGGSEIDPSLIADEEESQGGREGVSEVNGGIPLVGEDVNPDDEGAGTSTAGSEETAGVSAGESYIAGADGEVGAVCSNSIQLNCSSGERRFTLGGGHAQLNQYECGNGFNYPGKELFFEFVDSEPQQLVVEVSPVIQQYTISYIFFALRGDDQICAPEGASCLATQDTMVNQEIIFDYDPSHPLWMTIDPRIGDAQGAEFILSVECVEITCGNGELNPDEGCDDGNTDGNDGCSPTCDVEFDYSCEGEPSVCTEESPVTDCPNMRPIGAGSFIGDTRLCTEEYPTVSGGCGNESATLGPDQSYLVTVPADHIITARLDDIGNPNYNVPKVWLSMDSQNPTDHCVQLNGEQVTWHNGSASPREVLLVVDGGAPTAAGSYTLNVSFDRPRAQRGLSCTSPFEITDSGRYQGVTSDASNYYGGMGGACIRVGGHWGYNGGPDHVYRVTLEPGERLQTTSIALMWDHVISIHDQCDDLELSCLQWDTYGAIDVTNDTAEPKEYFITVGGFFTYDSGPYTLDVTRTR